MSYHNSAKNFIKLLDWYVERLCEDISFDFKWPQDM